MTAVKPDFCVFDGVGSCCPAWLRGTRTALTVCLGLAMGQGDDLRSWESVNRSGGSGTTGMVFGWNAMGMALSLAASLYLDCLLLWLRGDLVVPGMDGRRASGDPDGYLDIAIQ